MRICLVSSYVPFINGGARFIVEWLEQKLREHGHEVERFYIPFVDSPHDLVEQMTAFRLIDLSQSCDRLICFRPPSYVLPHPNKVLWFIHHIRVFYDMWDTPYRPVPDTPGGRAVRQALIDADTNALNEAKAIYTNSKVVSDRLRTYNGVASTPLYPPVFQPERFRNEGYGDEIVAVCRIEPHKRQHLLVEAMRHVKSGVKLRLCGECASQDYARQLRETIRLGGLEERVVIEDRWISEAEKVERLATALGAAYLPFDEDSYGYPSLEAAHSGKAVLTTTDSGGVLELVEDGRNGLIAEPDPVAIAAAMDRFHRDRQDAKRWGEGNTQRLAELKIDWSHVVTTLTG
jgi:glycosyltransferase involved in cell wall biosynthesis